MPIATECPHCHKRLVVPSNFHGSQGTCPACGQQVLLAGKAPESGPPTALPKTPGDQAPQNAATADSPAGVPPPQASTSTTSASVSTPSGSNAPFPWGKVVLGVSFALFLFGKGGCLQSDKSKKAPVVAKQSIEQGIAQWLTSNPNELFRIFHPVGTGKSVTVHSVQLQNRGADVLFTIYWEGPLTKDGYTKVAAHYDADVGRWTSADVVLTNGVTNREFNQAMFDFGFELGSNLFNNN